ncbi:unnamed protein product, partial [Polarella glacialis]
MADYVEQHLQDMVPELDDLRRKNIFNEDEIRHVVRRRRDFEYTLQRKPGKPQDYLNYVRYEVALETLRRRKSVAMNWRKRSVSDWAGIRRIHNVLRRGAARFKGDKRLWYQHVDFCLRSGSTKTLNRVLLRAVKYHPKEIHFWLLAADRELQQGHVAAARKLILRGMRCAPKSVKLLVEFVRLEAGVAGQLLTVKSLADEEEDGGEAAAAKATADVWAPSRLLLRRGLTRLAGRPSDCAEFVVACADILQAAAVKWSQTEGFKDFAEALRQAAADRRPGALGASIEESVVAAWSEVSDSTAAAVWRVWWTQERNTGVTWTQVTAAVAACGRGAVISHIAEVLAKEMTKDGPDADESGSALLQLASAPAAAEDPDAALSLLECLSGGIGSASGKKMKAAYRELLQRSAETHPRHLRLGLLAGQELSEGGAAAAAAAAALLRRAADLGADDAAQLLLATGGAAADASSASGSTAAKGRKGTAQ